MITIGVTTYNRLEILQIMAQSLLSSNLPENCNMRIYDDASTDYGIDTVKKLFPNATSIKRNKINLHADRNSYTMYEDFLKSGDDILFHADSDLIFTPDWLGEGLRLYTNSNGVLSLYNSMVVEGTEINNFLLEKPYVGAAGVMLSRECVEKIMNRFSHRDIEGDMPFFDWRWCRYLRELGHNIYCVKDSLVQHIGFSGQNSSRMMFDYGVGYTVKDKVQGQIINDILLQMSIRDKDARRWYALFPFHVIPKEVRIVVYGYGSVGKDYVKQIKSSRYCYLEAVVDENFSAMIGVSDPAGLSKMQFDFILLAMLDIKAQQEVKDKLLKKFPAWEDKIIVHRPDRIDK